MHVMLDKQGGRRVAESVKVEPLTLIVDQLDASVLRVLSQPADDLRGSATGV